MIFVQIVFGLVTSLNLEREQLFIKMAFLHGDFDKEIFMKQKRVSKKRLKKNLVCQLKKSLYRLKQMLRQRNKKLML